LIAERWELTRDDLDRFGARSHELAGKATAAGAFKKEIHPIKVAGEDGTELFETDEGIRTPNLEKMAALPPAFKADGVVTAANSSQITDGASALLIMEREMAESLGLEPRARFAGFALAGTDPITMLTGPIPATRKVLEKSGLTLKDVGLVEINEAFASVVLAWKKELDIDDAWFEDSVNVNGGAIALGHPLGASGARLMTTLLHAMEERDARYGLQTMCEGGGLANATLIELL
jgi:acetyl-CoA acyltransferase